jgi:hypothetical protein
MTYQEITKLLDQGNFPAVIKQLGELDIDPSWEEYLLDKLEDMSTASAAKEWLQGLIDDYYRLPF